MISGDDRGMSAEKHTWIDSGIYSIPEASQLTGISQPRLRRWLRGYSFRRKDQHVAMPPVWSPASPIVEGRMAFTFRDLVEVRFVDAFIREGVSWRTIRRAEKHATDLFGDTHPFSTNRFKTDGRDIFVDISASSREKALVDIAARQRVFARIIRPYLCDLDFDSDSPVRWWPLGKQRRVVIDPQRAFGQPITSSRSIPTKILCLAYRENSSFKAVADWYEVAIREVRDAITFEKQIAA